MAGTENELLNLQIDSTKYKVLNSEQFYPAYNSTSTYAIGDIVSYKGKFYICISAISTAEAWTAAHWAETNPGTQIVTLTTGSGTLSDLQYAQVQSNSCIITSTWELTSAIQKPVYIRSHRDSFGKLIYRNIHLMTFTNTPGQLKQQYVYITKNKAFSIESETVANLPIANPTLAGTESNLNSLQVGNTKYALPFDSKQDILVSGTNIKTINNTSLLGSGDLAINKSSVGLGNVDNTSDADKPISTATQTALDSKQDILVSGTNIKTVNNTSILGSGNISVQPTLSSGSNIKTINSESILGSGDISVQPVLVGSGTGQNIKTINSNSILGDGNINLQVPLVGSGAGQNIKTINNSSILGTGNLSLQPTLVGSGTGQNIKTINNTSVLGSGNISVQPVLVSGTNIKTINNESLLGSGNININTNSMQEKT